MDRTCTWHFCVFFRFLVENFAFVNVALTGGLRGGFVGEDGDDGVW